MFVGCSVDARWSFDRYSLDDRSMFVGGSIDFRWGVDAQIDIRHMLDRLQIDVR